MSDFESLSRFSHPSIVKEEFEPKKSGLNEAKLERLYNKNPIALSAMNKVRTWIMGNSENLYIPDFNK